MQERKDFFSKLLLIKPVVLSIMICAMVLYSIAGVIMTFTSDNNLYSMLPKIIAPLIVIGIGLIVSVICFRKFASNSSSVRVTSFITLILGVIDVVLTILLIWGVIPTQELAYNNPSNSTYYPYIAHYVPTFAFKAIVSLLYITLFTFVSMIILDLREEQKLVRFLKYITVGIWGVAIVSTASIVFVNAYEVNLEAIRMEILQIIVWIIAIVLTITTICLARTKPKQNHMDSHIAQDVPPQPPIGEEVKKSTEEYRAPERPIMERPAVEQVATESPTISEPVARKPIEEQPIVEQSALEESVLEELIPDYSPRHDESYPPRHDESMRSATPNPLQSKTNYNNPEEEN